MATVVFHILNTPSHLNASFKLAKCLKLNGHRVSYFTFPDVENLIIKQGFDFYSVPLTHYLQTSTTLHKSKIKNKLEQFKRKRQYSKVFLKGDFYNQMLTDLSPDLIIVDLSLIYYSVFLLEKKVPFIITCTKVCLNKTNDVPPFTSSYIPRNFDRKERIYIMILWYKQIFKNNLRNLMDRVRIDRVSRSYLAKEYLKIHKYSIKEIIDTNRSSHMGLKNVPELILSPFHFDFPRTYADNQLHIGPVVDLDRNEVKYDLHFPGVMVKIIRRIENEGKKLIYCALGNCTFEYVQSRILFYTKIINYFINGNKDAILILATGNNIDPNVFQLQTENVFIFKHVPQLKILRKCDMMINHGGMQSVTECIMLSVPMLAYPLSHQEFDQTGNAARIEFHRIGIAGNMTTDSEKEIYTKIDSVLNTMSFKINIELMRNKLNHSKDFEKGIMFIEEYLKKN